MKTAITIITLLLSAGLAQEASLNQSVRLLWDANTEPDIAGYRVHVGTSSGSYQDSYDSPSNQFTLPATNQVQFAAVTALNELGLESDYSNEVQIPALPKAPVNLRAETITVGAASP